MNLIKLENKMDAIIMNCKNCKTSDISTNYQSTFWIKYTIREVMDMLFYQILACTIHGKI